jgi:hypothetical protein
MKTYNVLYALEVPHFGSIEIEAESDEAALALAMARTDIRDIATDADHDDPVLARIVHIEDGSGTDVYRDIPLDDFRLISGDDRIALNDAAADLLLGLKQAIRAMNNTPSFDTGLPASTPADEGYRRTRTMSSYTLLPHLEAIVRKAEGPR